MAKFTVTMVEMKVAADAKGAVAKFRGKTLKNCVEFAPSLDGKGHDTSILAQANEKFAYVAAKLEKGKIHRAYSTSKIAKWAREELTGKVVEVDVELEAAKKQVREEREAAKSQQQAKRQAKKSAHMEKVASNASIEEVMAEAEKEDERRSLIAAVNRCNLSKSNKQTILGLIG